jgi:hypothetical protein
VARELQHPDWVRRLNLFGDVVGDPARLVDLDAVGMLALARSTTGLTDLGEADWPGWTDAYDAALRAIDGEARLHVLGRVLTRGEVLKVLRTWLRLQAHWDARPAVTSIAVDAPLFIVGPPRTGTTILLELLALDPQLRAPLAWEALHPLALDGDEAHRLQLSEPEQEFWSDIHPEFMTMHELASNLPCECVHFLMYDFAGPYWSMQYDAPSYTSWQLEHLDVLARVYRLHRRMLQTFADARPDPTERTWLLKSPAHLSMLEQLFAEYPDARVIHTHRDPRRFVASLVSIVSALRFMRSDDVDVAALGAAMEVTYQMFLEQAMVQRADGTIPDDQIVDTHFLELMDDPVAMLQRVYGELDMTWPAGHSGVVREYLANKPKAKHGAHSYTFADVGLDEEHVRKSFAPYVAHYGITEE